MKHGRAWRAHGCLQLRGSGLPAATSAGLRRVGGDVRRAPAGRPAATSAVLRPAGGDVRGARRANMPELSMSDLVRTEQVCSCPVLQIRDEEEEGEQQGSTKRISKGLDIKYLLSYLRTYSRKCSTN